MPSSKNVDNEKGTTSHVDYVNDSAVECPKIQLSDEQYERLFFQPGGSRPGNLAARFANPTPLGIISFLLLLTPVSVYFMQWDGSSASSAVDLVGPCYYIGGAGLIIAAIGEWILGNTFPFVVFFAFGGFWASQGNLRDPSVMINSAFEGGSDSVAYNAGMEIYYIFWAVLVAMFFIAAMRTNIIFVLIFAALFFVLCLFAAAHHNIGAGNIALANTLLKAAGGFAFAGCIAGWYLFAGLIFASTGLPFVIPFGDLSGRFQSKRRGV